MKKTKCYCDYCGKECEETPDLNLPIREHISEYAVNKQGVKLMKLDIGEEIVHKQQDICPECQEKITYLLKLTKNVNIDDGHGVSMTF